MSKVFGIVAVDSEWGIAKNHMIPWYYPEDFKFFKKITLGSHCVMGFHTYKEIAEKMKYDGSKSLLPKRISMIVSNTNKNKVIVNDTTYCTSNLDVFLQDLKWLAQPPTVFLIGGKRIYEEYINYMDGFYITSLKKNYNCDLFLNKESIHKNFQIENVILENDDMVIKYWKRNENN